MRIVLGCNKVEMRKQMC